MPTHKHADTEICRSFHLPKTLNARLVEEAETRGEPVAKLLRRAIVALLDRFERERDAAAGLPPARMAAEPPPAMRAPLRRVADGQGRSTTECRRKRT